MSRKANLIVIFFAAFLCVARPSSAEVGGVDIHGFISQGFLKTSDYEYPIEKTDEGTFQFNEMGIVFSSQVSDKLHMGLQFLSRDFGEEGNNEVKLDWCYGDYAWKDYLGFRAGLIKAPIGLYNETRDVDVLRTSIFLPSGVYNEFYRDALTDVKGVGAYGTLPGGFSYQAVYGVGTISVDGGLTKIFASRVGGVATSAGARDFMLGSLQWEPPLPGMRIGGSILNVDPEATVSSPLGELTLDFKDLIVTTASLEYVIGKLTLAAERAWYEVKFDVKPTPIKMVYYPLGYYGSASYRFTDWFTLGLYYSDFFQNKEAIGNVDENLRDWCLTFRFDVNMYWAIKLEAHQMRGFYNIKSDTSVANGDDVDYYLFGAKITYTF
jgi:hypothetical protein